MNFLLEYAVTDINDFIKMNLANLASADFITLTIAILPQFKVTIN
ncbi:hypothetical protein [Pediococcus pentosaceus]|jgi:hypothetical protein|nr:hypothetical protein [Pediococcus pentosaceus]WRI50763.1 hypothetical protein PSR64_07730 [Pediococcus pentosaceus]